MIKRSIATKVLIIFTVLVLSALVLSFALKDINAFAKTNTYFSAEQYTDSDYLLNSDGSTSKRKINNFADDVKAAKSNAVISDVAQVIPLEYLESNEECATFSYMGREYGLIIA